MKIDSILVALESPRSIPLLRAAAELAQKANAELRAIYVEKEEWFEASRLSITQTISSFKGELLEIDEGRMTRESRALRNLLERRFSDLGNSLHIRHTYISVRGSIDKELMKAASETDLVMIEGKGDPIQRLGTNVRYLAEECKVPVLVWNQGNQWPAQITGLCRTPEESKSTVDWAFSLGDQLNRNIRLLWTEKPDWDRKWLQEMDHHGSEWQDISSRLQRISEHYPDLRMESLKRYPNSLIIVKRSDLQFSPRELLKKLSRHSFLFLG